MSHTIVEYPWEGAIPGNEQNNPFDNVSGISFLVQSLLSQEWGRNATNIRKVTRRDILSWSEEILWFSRAKKIKTVWLPKIVTLFEPISSSSPDSLWITETEKIELIILLNDIRNWNTSSQNKDSHENWNYFFCSNQRIDGNNRNFYTAWMINTDQITWSGEAIAINGVNYRSISYFWTQFPELNLEKIQSIFRFIRIDLQIIDYQMRWIWTLILLPEDIISRISTHEYVLRRPNGFKTYYSSTKLNTEYWELYDLGKILDYYPQRKWTVPLLKNWLLYSKEDFEKIAQEEWDSVLVDTQISIWTDLKWKNKISLGNKVYVFAQWERVTDNPYHLLIAKNKIDFKTEKNKRITQEVNKFEADRIELNSTLSRLLDANKKRQEEIWWLYAYLRSENQALSEVSAFLSSSDDSYISSKVYQFQLESGYFPDKKTTYRYMYAFLYLCLRDERIEKFLKNNRFAKFSNITGFSRILKKLFWLISIHIEISKHENQVVSDLNQKINALSERILQYKKWTVELDDWYLVFKWSLYFLEDKMNGILWDIDSPLSSGQIDREIEYSRTRIYQNKLYIWNPKVLFVWIEINWNDFLKDIPKHQISIGEEHVFLYVDIVTKLIQQWYAYQDGKSGWIISMNWNQWVNIESVDAIQTIADIMHRWSHAVRITLQWLKSNQERLNSLETIRIFDLDTWKMQILYHKNSLVKLIQDIQLSDFVKAN